MIDKDSKKSKGYGFISYDNPNSAQQAMNHMNGFQANFCKFTLNQKKDLRFKSRKEKEMISWEWVINTPLIEK